MSHHRPHVTRHGFTLIELLVAIAILALLAGLTIKGVSKFRQAGWATDTQNQLMTIQNAIQAYYSTFNAYPGPLPNRTLGELADNPGYGIALPSISLTFNTDFDDEGLTDVARVTGSENLVLGLFGGLVADSTQPGTAFYDAGAVGQGPSSLNALAPKKYGAFLNAQNQLSWRPSDTNAKLKTGRYADDITKGTPGKAANDSIIPELVDRFPQGMPILYLRADRGAAWASPPSSPNSTENNVISDDANADPSQNVAQYHLKHIRGYTAAISGQYIGENKRAVNGSTAHGLNSVDLTKTLSGDGPFDAYPYLKNEAVTTLSPSATPHSGDVARKKDEYILISPGIDRIYGTKDDITNFGSVVGD